MDLYQLLATNFRSKTVIIVGQKVTETAGGRLGNICWGRGHVLSDGFIEMDYAKVGIKLWIVQTGP
jgi:hypothetical protein